MINANELRIGNLVKCKVSNDAGIYSICGIDGWIRIFESKEDERLYHMDLDKQIKSKKTAQYHDERLIKLAGGVRNGEKYPESKIGGIAFSPEILLAFDFKEIEDNIFGKPQTRYVLNSFCYTNGFLTWRSHPIPHIKYVHRLQNIYFDLTGEELRYFPKATVPA
jgi:hypothetical protein